MKTYVVNSFDNSTTEIVCDDGTRRITYSTGDIVFMYNRNVVGYLTHDGKSWSHPDFEKVYTSMYDLINGNLFRREP